MSEQRPGEPEAGPAFGPEIANQDIFPAKEAIEERPALRFALEFPELDAPFQKYERPANAKKKHSRRLGLAAVICGVIALWVVAYDSYIPSAPAAHGAAHVDHAASPTMWTAIVLGLIAFALGMGSVFRFGSKHTWLINRYGTERLRQFHFQFMVMNLPDLIAAIGDPEKQQAYMDKRRDALNDVLRNHMGPNNAIAEQKLAAMVKNHGDPPQWLAPEREAASIGELGPAAQDFFALYRKHRFEHQFQYAKDALDDTAGTGKFTPARLERVLGSVGAISIGAVLALHLGLVLLVVFHAPHTWFQFAHILILCFAILGLGGRALEEGMQPQRDVERLENYVGACEIAMEKFNAAASDRARFEAMRDFERLSMEEMRQFLRTQHRARYLL